MALTDEMRRMRKKGLEDFHYFVGAIWLNRDGRQKYFKGRYVQYVCERFQFPEQPNQLFLLPRDHFKTTIITSAGSAWWALTDPETRIVLGGSDKDKGKKYLSAVRQMFKQNVLLRQLYGVGVGRPDRADMFNLTTRPLSVTTPECTFNCHSVGESDTGAHYPRGIFDDLVDESNYDSQVGRESVENFLKDTPNILEKVNYRQVLVGTRWHVLDAYGKIIEAEASSTVKNWEIISRAVREQGEYIMPLRFNDEVMASIYHRTRDPNHVSGQYYQLPIESSKAMFKQAFLEANYVPKDEAGHYVFPKGLAWYLLMDTAFKSKERNDWTAWLLLGVDHKGGYWVADAGRGKWAGAQQIETMFMLLRKYPEAEWLGLEDKASGSVLVDWLNVELEKVENQALGNRVRKLQIENIDINARALPLTRMWEDGRIHVRIEDMDLINELLTFPNGASNDLVAAFSLAPRWCIAPDAPKPEEEELDPQAKLIVADKERAFKKHEEKHWRTERADENAIYDVFAS